jgi:O-methyltransferase
LLPCDTSHEDRECYLNLLKRNLSGRVTDLQRLQDVGKYRPSTGWLECRRPCSHSSALPVDGVVTMDTMIGSYRLDNLHDCIRQVLHERVPGDLIEAGVWRGGATIFMRAALAAYGDLDRRVWVADSFQGLPAPDPSRYPADATVDISQASMLAVDEEAVRRNFVRYGMLDDRVVFVPGWFRESLPDVPIDQLAVLRIDADLYQSTIEALDALYERVSDGGFVIIDDYGAIEACRAAVEDFRRTHAVDDELVRVDHTGVFWRKRDACADMAARDGGAWEVAAA